MRDRWRRAKTRRYWREREGWHLPYRDPEHPLYEPEPVAFLIGDDDSIEWSGYRRAGTWNGWDRVAIEPSMRDLLAAYMDRCGHLESARDVAGLPVAGDGLIDLDGYTTRIVEVPGHAYH